MAKVVIAISQCARKHPVIAFFRPNGLLYRGGSVREYRYVLQDLFAFQKAYRSVTFKGSQTVQIPKCCSSLGIAIEGTNIDLISCKPLKVLPFITSGILKNFSFILWR